MFPYVRYVGRLCVGTWTSGHLSGCSKTVWNVQCALPEIGLVELVIWHSMGARMHCSNSDACKSMYSSLLLDSAKYRVSSSGMKVPFTVNSGSSLTEKNENKKSSLRTGILKKILIWPSSTAAAI